MYIHDTKTMIMTKVDFSITINAPKEKVWEVLWGEPGYRKWTSVFMEGSYAETDWQEGSRIKFLSPSGDGMSSLIRRKVPFEQMVFEHRGEIKNGVEQNMEWAGATEAYYLNEQNGVTELRVSMDATEEFKDYFSTTFPKALQVVKQTAEGSLS